VLVKIVIVVLLLAILASLMTSMSFLIRDESSRLTALKLRVALSITLMLFVLLSWHMGWIEPHGLIPKK
jgi:hypothetical protein